MSVPSLIIINQHHLHSGQCVITKYLCVISKVYMYIMYIHTYNMIYLLGVCYTYTCSCVAGMALWYMGMEQ